MAESKRKRDDETEEANFTETAKKPAAPDHSTVTLKVQCNAKEKALVFKVKRRSKMRNLLMSFCKVANLEYRSTRFVIDHRPFSHHKSPNQLELEDFDEIDAFVDGVGA